MPFTRQLFLDLTQGDLSVPHIFTLPWSLPAESTSVCVQSQGPMKTKSKSPSVFSYMKNKSSSLFEMQKPPNNKREQKKPKRSKGRQYFYHPLVIRLLLAVNFSSVSALSSTNFSQAVGQESGALCLHTTSAPPGHFLRLLLHCTLGSPRGVPFGRRSNPS